MRRLRDFDGCAWDREQTHESLRPYLLEEACEAIDAIDRGDIDALYDELGDVLLQVIFHAEIAKQYGDFELSDITTTICRKMIRRHPHVFGQAQADNPDAVRGLWDEVKQKEHACTSAEDAQKIADAALPALLRASKLSRRARKYGVNLPSSAEAWSAWNNAPSESTLGELLLALAAHANANGIDSELSLVEAVKRCAAAFEHK